MKKRCLVIYYSRTGNTKKVGKEIARIKKADIEEVIDLRDRKRKIIGWIISGRDASLKKTTEIKYSKDPSDYEKVFIGTPVWAWTLTPAIRTYLSQNNFKKVYFFCTHGGQKGKTFEEMEKLSKKPEATLEIHEKELNSKETLDKIKEFCKR